MNAAQKAFRVDPGRDLTAFRLTRIIASMPYRGPTLVLSSTANPADWLAAFGTVLAAIGTVGTLIATVGLFYSDRKRRRDDERRVQAELVSTWAEPVVHGAAKRPVKIANLSNEPVYDINVFLRPREWSSHTEATFSKSVLPPQTTHCQDVTRRDPTRDVSTVPRVQIAFTDRHQQRWLRHADGSLQQLENDSWRDHLRGSKK